MLIIHWLETDLLLAIAPRSCLLFGGSVDPSSLFCLFGRLFSSYLIFIQGGVLLVFLMMVEEMKCCSVE